MKLAFATEDMTHVDAHFGWARHFAIYEVSPDGYRFVDTVCCDDDAREDGNEDKLEPRLEAIKDCTIVYVAAIGGAGAARVVARKIHPIKVSVTEEIARLLTRLTETLRKSPPPWLRKALLKERGETVRFDDEACCG